jgi:hypothetical protein
MEPKRAVDTHSGGLEAQKMEPCVVYGPVVVDSHHYDKQDPDPQPWL